jgi:hypothetical protein
MEESASKGSKGMGLGGRAGVIIHAAMVGAGAKGQGDSGDHG